MKRGELNLHVSDLERSVKFYRDALGFEVCADPVMGPSDGSWEKIRRDDVVITLFRTQGHPRLGADLLVTDFDATLERLEKAGARIGRVRAWPGGRFTIFRDPDGIGWEVIEERT